MHLSFEMVLPSHRSSAPPHQLFSEMDRANSRRISSAYPRQSPRSSGPPSLAAMTPDEDHGVGVSSYDEEIELL